MAWISFLMILGLILAAVGLAVETLRWLLIIALVAVVTGATVGWSRRTAA
jgi:hypothetical protein